MAVSTPIMPLTGRTLLIVWQKTLRNAAAGLGNFRLGKMESVGTNLKLNITDLSQRVPLATVGFQSRRWTRYVDDYLFGGPAFINYLNHWTTQPLFNFGGAEQHTLGPCVEWIEITPDLIRLHSRATDLCPTAILDLNLLWWVGQVTGIRRGLWEIQKAKLAVWQSVAYRDMMKIIVGTPLAPMLLSYLRKHENHREDLRFARAKSVLKRRTFEGSLDEEEVIRSPIRINPNDLQILYGVRRTKIQGFLKQQYGWSAQGSGNRSYSWDSYQDPVFQSVMKRFDLDPAHLPPIDVVAQRRSARHENNGVENDSRLAN